MTFDERVRAIEPLGFNERQTRFLVTVALHGGFCLRRHYTAFTGLKYGAATRGFLDRLVARGVARRYDFRRDRGHVYHLHRSGIYDAIDQRDNRNRRRVSAAMIARKLMVLDYVLKNPQVEWAATEDDKVALFTTRFGIRPSELPQRVYVGHRRQSPVTVRYFIHKLPVFVDSQPSRPSFVFLVTDTTGEGFGQFLRDHLRLLNGLPSWRIVVVAPPHILGFPACHAAMTKVAGAKTIQTSDDLEDLRWYFDQLAMIEQNTLHHVTPDAVRRFHELRRRFAAAEFEAMFQRWKADGDSAFALSDSAALRSAIADRRGELVTHQLTIRYDRFGTRAGVS